MKTDFWIERWQKREIGFHQRSINPYLQHHWPALGLAPGTRVFVPLCGKSLDMHWLHDQGHSVIGVEVAREAVADFFKEWGVQPRIAQAGAFERWQFGHIELWCGDFFDLSAADLGDVGAVFDRAALIALPETLRQAYAKKLREILPASSPVLLVTADYAQHEMPGPPFAVSDAEVRTLFDGSRIELLEENDVTDVPDNQRFRERGLSRLVERVYRVG
ncbi:thiopurine S-methyltransferase [Povalibacter sp.]|uniref:thiopurine S-methyltransferase n=1 Tax=Povalibacter sp. TaxID=1962978 RepID=UPI002F411CED